MEVRMSISVENIRKYMYSAKIYEEACSYIDTGQVEIAKIRSFWKTEAAVEGIVKGVGCKVTISNDDIASYACNCDDFKNKR